MSYSGKPQTVMEGTKEMRAAELPMVSPLRGPGSRLATRRSEYFSAISTPLVRYSRVVLAAVAACKAGATAAPIASIARIILI
jgi:hypothetical protein